MYVKSQLYRQRTVAIQNTAAKSYVCGPDSIEALPYTTGILYLAVILGCSDRENHYDSYDLWDCPYYQYAYNGLSQSTHIYKWQIVWTL